MSITAYDEAVVNKIKRWVKDERVTILSPEQTRNLFEVVVDTTNDKPIQLPLICIRRGREIDIVNVQKTPLTSNGGLIEYKTTQNPDTKEVMSKGIYLQSVQISIPYQLDIYTRYQSEANEYIRNFVYNLINYPKVTIEIPYNDINLTHDSNITLQSSIADNSDIPEVMFHGQFSRFTLSFFIEDAHLFSAPIKDGAFIEGVSIETK